MMESLTQKHEIEIHAKPEEVWRAITSPDLTRQYYFESAVESDWQPGSPLRYRLPDGSVAIEGVILESDPPRRLASTFSALWEPALRLDPPHRVVWEIEPSASGSKVTVSNRFDDRTATYVQVLGGMSVILNGLKRVLESR